MGSHGVPRSVHTLRDAIASFLESTGLSRATVSDQIGRAWVEVLGPAIAKHTRLSRTVRQGVLTVEVDSSALLSELSGFRKAEILRGLQDRVKRRHIEDIKFKLGTGL